MYDDRPAEVPTWVSRVPAVAGTLLVVIAGLVLVGWARDFALALEVAPALPRMKANMALCCLAAGLSLLGSGARSRWRFAAAVPVVIGTATLVQWIGGFSLGIDELLVEDRYSASFPGRPSLHGALAVALFGLARLTGAARSTRLGVIGGAVTAAFVTVGLVLEIGFLFGAPELTATNHDGGLTLPNAVCIGLLMIALLALNAERRPISYLWHAGMTGTLTRRLLPAVIVLPPALGILRLMGQEQGWYGLTFGAATFTCSMIVVLVLVVTVTARTIDVAEREAAAAASALRDAEQRARYLADHDPLTQVWNRRHFERELTAALSSEQDEGGLLVIDIDHFKDVNDTLGHHAGDELLCAVARGLTACVAGRGTVSRIGGDEFAVLLHRGDLVEVELAATEVVAAIDAVAAEPALQEATVRVSASVGVALFAGLDPADRTRRALLTRADEALYDAKRAGRGRHAVHGQAVEPA